MVGDALCRLSAPSASSSRCVFSPCRTALAGALCHIPCMDTCFLLLTLGALFAQDAPSLKESTQRKHPFITRRSLPLARSLRVKFILHLVDQVEESPKRMEVRLALYTLTHPSLPSRLSCFQCLKVDATFEILGRDSLANPSSDAAEPGGGLPLTLWPENERLNVQVKNVPVNTQASRPPIVDPLCESQRRNPSVADGSMPRLFPTTHALRFTSRGVGVPGVQLQHHRKCKEWHVPPGGCEVESGKAWPREGHGREQQNCKDRITQDTGGNDLVWHAQCALRAGVAGSSRLQPLPVHYGNLQLSLLRCVSPRCSWSQGSLTSHGGKDGKLSTTGCSDCCRTNTREELHPYCTRYGVYCIGFLAGNKHSPGDSPG